MPRKKSRGDDQLLNAAPPLMLPAPRVHKHGEHDVDPYKPAIGAVPGHVSNEKIVGFAPLQRELTAEEQQTRVQLRDEAAEKGARYNSWLDALIAFGGNKVQALCLVYGLPEHEVRIRQYELEADVRTGMGASDVGELLDRNNISAAAQARILSNHAYSDNPAASLSAIKIIQEMQGDTADVGSFESFLRLSKLSGKG